MLFSTISSSICLVLFIITTTTTILFSSTVNHHHQHFVLAQQQQASCILNLDSSKISRDQKTNSSYFYLPHPVTGTFPDSASTPASQFVSSSSSSSFSNCGNQVTITSSSSSISVPLIITSALPPSLILIISGITFNSTSLNFPLGITNTTIEDWIVVKNETSLIVVEPGVSSPIIIEGCFYKFSPSVETEWFVSHFLYAPEYRGPLLLLKNNIYQVKNAKSQNVYEFFRPRDSNITNHRMASYFYLRWCHIRQVANNYDDNNFPVTTSSSITSQLQKLSSSSSSSSSLSLLNQEQTVIVVGNTIDIAALNLATVDYMGRLFEQLTLVEIIAENEGSNNIINFRTKLLTTKVERNTFSLQISNVPPRESLMFRPDPASQTYESMEDVILRFDVSLISILAKDVQFASVVNSNRLYFSAKNSSSVRAVLVNCSGWWYPLFRTSPVSTFNSLPRSSSSSSISENSYHSTFSEAMEAIKNRIATIINNNINTNEVPPSYVYILSNDCDQIIEGPKSLRNVLVGFTTQYAKAWAMPLAEWFPRFPVRDSLTLKTFGTMFYIGTARISGNKLTSSQSCFTEAYAGRSATEPHSGFFNLAQVCDSVFASPLYMENPKAVMKATSLMMTNATNLAIDQQMEKTARLNYQYDHFRTDANTFSVSMEELQDPPLPLSSSGSGGGGNEEPPARYLKVQAFFLIMWTQCTSFYNFIFTNNNMPQPHTRSNYGTVQGIWFGGVRDAVEFHSAVVLAKDRPFLEIRNKLEFTHNKFFSIDMFGERCIFYGIEFESGVNNTFIEIMNLSSNVLNSLTLEAQSSESKLALYVATFDLAPLTRYFFLINNTMTGEVLVPSFGVCFAAFVTTPVPQTSTDPAIAAAGVSLHIIETLEVKRNRVDLAWGSTGPMFVALITSAGTLLVENGDVLVEENSVVGTLKYAGQQVSFIPVKLTPILTTTIKMSSVGATSSPRQIMIRTTGLRMRAGSVIFNNNTLVLLGDCGFLDIRLGGMPSGPPPVNSSVAVALLAVKSFIDVMQKSIIFDNNILHIDVSPRTFEPLTTSSTNGYGPTVFGTMFFAELDSTVSIADSFSITHSSITAIVRRTDPTRPFTSHFVRMTLLAMFPLPFASVPLNSTIAISVRGKILLSANTILLASGVGTALSTCREGPASDLPTSTIVEMFASNKKNADGTANVSSDKFTALFVTGKEITTTARAALCISDWRQIPSDLPIFNVADVPFACPNIWIENILIRRLTNDEIRNLVVSSGMYNHTSSSAWAQPYKTNPLSQIPFSKNEQDKVGFALNLPEKCFAPTTSLYLAHSEFSSRSMIPGEYPVKKLLSASQSSWTVKCAGIDTTLAKSTVCVNISSCSMTSCLKTSSKSQTPFSRTVSLRPPCDPTMRLVASPGASAKFPQNNYRQITTRMLLTGRSAVVRFELVSDNFEEFPFTFFSSSFGAGSLQPSVLPVVKVKLIDASSSSSSSSNDNNNNNGNDVITTIPTELLSANRSGSFSIDVEFKVIKPFFNEFSVSTAQLSLCIDFTPPPPSLLNDDDTNSPPASTLVAGNIFSCDASHLLQNKKNLLLCSNPSLDIPRRWLGIPSLAMSSTSGTATAGAVLSPVVLNLLSGRPSSVTAAVALQRQRFVMSMADCSSTQEAELDFLSSPLRLSFGRLSGAYFRGAVVGNTAILVIVGCVGVVLVMYRAHQTRMQHFRHQCLRSYGGDDDDADDEENKKNKNKRQRQQRLPHLNGLSYSEAKDVSLLHPKFQADFGHPTRVFVFMLISLQGTLMSSFALLFVQSKVDGVDAIFGIIGLIIPVGFIGFLLYFLFPREKFANSVFAKDNTTMISKQQQPKYSALKMLWFYLMDEIIAWKNRSRKKHKNDGKRTRTIKNNNDSTKKPTTKQQQTFFVPYAVQRFGDAFEPAIPRYYWFVMAHDVGVTSILSFLASLTPTPDTTGCYALQIITAIVISGAFLLSSAAPLFCRAENIFLFLTNFCTCVSLILVLAAAYSAKPEEQQQTSSVDVSTTLLDVADGVDLAITLLSVLKLVLDVFMFLNTTFDLIKRDVEKKNSKKPQTAFRTFLIEHFPSLLGKKNRNNFSSSTSKRDSHDFDRYGNESDEVELFSRNRYQHHNVNNKIKREYKKQRSSSSTLFSGHYFQQISSPPSSQKNRAEIQKTRRMLLQDQYDDDDDYDEENHYFKSENESSPASNVNHRTSVFSILANSSRRRSSIQKTSSPTDEDDEQTEFKKLPRKPSSLTSESVPGRFSML